MKGKEDDVKTTTCKYFLRQVILKEIESYPVVVTTENTPEVAQYQTNCARFIQNSEDICPVFKDVVEETGNALEILNQGFNHLRTNLLQPEKLAIGSITDKMVRDAFPFEVMLKHQLIHQKYKNLYNEICVKKNKDVLL